MQDKYREKRSAYKRTKQYKVKRMLWKRKRLGKAVAEENAEGVTYSTGCELAGVADLVDHPAVMNHDLSPNEALPVFIDFETTGRSKLTCEVLLVHCHAISITSGAKYFRNFKTLHLSLMCFVAAGSQSWRPTVNSCFAFLQGQPRSHDPRAALRLDACLAMQLVAAHVSPCTV